MAFTHAGMMNSDVIDKDFLVYTETTGKALAAVGLTTNQIRNFFNEVKKNYYKPDVNRVRLLKPRLVYIVAKAKSDNDKKAMESFKKVIMPCIDILITKEAEELPIYLERFNNYLESILAYHKASESENKKWN